MPRIHVLPDLLVNKIAAGEVIERPSSVVKELIENSLDAGARCIDVDIEDGGRRLIRVSDDGSGMDREDLALCVRPHATSKIHCEEDLFGIRTLGFRGEALPSIGAVAQLRVVSRPAGADEAWEVRVSGERIEPATAAAARPGTSVEVRELFFNVPARQKFLRTPQTEMGHITEQLARIALVTPEVEFRLTHNGRNVHHLRPATGMRPRVADFYGKDLAEALLAIARDERGLKLAGLVALPVDSRSSAKWQYLFLNGRFIRDRFLAHAIHEAYRGLMDPNRHPVVFLALQIDPASVDVNVHPTKIEVRWRDSNLIYSQVLSALRDRFLNTDLTPGLSTDRAAAEAWRARGPQAQPGEQPAARMPLPNLSDLDSAEERRRQVRESIADYFKRTRPPAGPVAPPAPTRPTPVRSAVPHEVPVSQCSPDAASAPVPALESPTPPAADRPIPAQECLLPVEPAPASAERGNGHAPARVLQLHRTYLLAETPDGLLIIDQHALHERILFEQLCEQVAAGPLESQRMLLPLVLDLSPDHVGVIEQHAETLARLGFELTPYGAASIAVHAAPTLLQDDRLREFVRDMLDRLVMRAAPASSEMLVNELLSMMACKAAVKAGDPLTDVEIQALMRERHRVERSSNCPHGRPTSLRLTLRDLERQFKRG